MAANGLDLPPPLRRMDLICRLFSLAWKLSGLDPNQRILTILNQKAQESLRRGLERSGEARKGQEKSRRGQKRSVEARRAPGETRRSQERSRRGQKRSVEARKGPRETRTSQDKPGKVQDTPKKQEKLQDKPRAARQARRGQERSGRETLKCMLLAVMAQPLESASSPRCDKRVGGAKSCL